MKRGDKFMHRGSEAKVMAAADGYVMARLPGCMPFVISEKDARQHDDKEGNDG